MYASPMRKVILGAAISLDGYLARPDGSIDFLVDVNGYSLEEAFANVDAIAFGRKTFDDAVKRGGGQYEPMGTTPTYVFSKTRAAGQSEGVVFVDVAPAAFVERLRAEPDGKDIFVMGGGELARSFLQEDVVDELHLGVYPVLLGDGIPFFPGGFGQREFKLLGSKAFGDEGFLELRYSRARS